MLLRRVLVFYWILSIVIAGLAGCSDPYAGRMEITGAVTLQGRPLKEGSILFEPLDGQGTQSGTGISNGEYKIPRSSGLKPGKYLVRITAGDGKTPVNEETAAPGGSTNIVSVDLIPDDWSTKSKHQVEVKSSGGNQFDFAVPNVNTRKKK